jgi:hypothetical protein
MLSQHDHELDDLKLLDQFIRSNPHLQEAKSLIRKYWILCRNFKIVRWLL